MKRVFWQSLGIAAAVLAAALLTIAINPPTTLINNRIAKAAKEATGRDLELKGRTSLRLQPLPALRLENVALMGPAGMAREPFVQAAAVEVEPALLTSLLRWSWTVTSIKIQAPQLMLITDKDGRANWQGLGATGAAGDGSMPAIGAIEVSGGLIRYTDQRTGYSEQSDQVAVRLTQVSPDTPVEAVFAAILKKQRFDGVARLAPMRTWAGDAPLPAKVTVVSEIGRAELDGTMALGSTPRLEARSSLDVPSLERFARWLELDPAQLGGGSLTFTGALALRPAPPPAAPATAPRGAAGGARETIAMPADLLQVTVRSGDFLLKDANSKPRIKAEKVDATVAFATLAQPIEAAADMTVNDERIQAHVLLQSPRALLPAQAGQSSPGKSAAVARVFSPHGRLELTGEVHPGKDPAFHGRAKGETSSLRGLARIANVVLPVDQGLESAAIDGEIAVSLSGVRVWNAAIKVDETEARGDLAVDLATKRAAITGKLALDRLDAGRYDPRLAEPPTAPAPVSPARSDDAASDERKEPGRDPFASTETVPLTRSLRSYLQGAPKRAGALEATGGPGAGGWSELALSPLKSLRDAGVDLDLDLSIKELKVAGRSAAVTNLKSTMRDGKLAINGPDIASHGGKLRLEAVVDTAPKVPTMRANLKADGVEADQLLLDLGMRPVLAGKTRIDATLSAAGTSEKALISSLKGRIETVAERSAVVGWDLRTSWRTIVDRLRSKLGMLPPNAQARTPIDRMTAVIELDQGVAETKDARVNSQYFSAIADAKANLILGELESTGTFSTFVAPELQLPFKVSGPLAEPAPDLDWDRIGFVQAISSLFKIGFSGGSGSATALESTRSGGDRELDDLLRRYLDRVEAEGRLTPADAAAARELRQLLGPSG